MIAAIDEKLDLFFTKGSSRYCDYTIWDELFSIALSYEFTDVNAYNYEIKRLRDLKNTFDTAREAGKRQGIAEAMKERSLANDNFAKTTELSVSEIKNN